MAEALAPLGLNVLLPLAPAAFDAAAAPVLPQLTLAALLPEALGAVVVGSGGSTLFDHFSAEAPEARDGVPNPFDWFTRRVVAEAVRASLEPLGVRYVVHHPFGGEPVIPFQRLGRAAGLGGPSPLGLQVHPTYGAWWAYRALVVVDRELPVGHPPGDGCEGCPAPCIDACPASAPARAGFSVAACHGHRLVAEPCRLSCAARVACIRGPEHRYRDEELAFHMAASMPRGPFP